MVQRNDDYEIEFSTQLLEAIQTIGLATTPLSQLQAIQHIPLIKTATQTTIILFTPNNPSTATVAATLDNRPNAENRLGSQYTSDTVPLLWTISPAETFLSNDVKTDPHIDEPSRSLLLSSGILSLVGVPLVTPTGHLGWLLIEKDIPSHFTPNQIMPLKILVQYIAAALQNRNLIQQLQTQTSQTQQERDDINNLYYITTSLSTTDSLKAAIQTLAGLKTYMQAQNILIYLIEDLGTEHTYCSAGNMPDAAFFRTLFATIQKHFNEQVAAYNVSSNPQWQLLASQCQSIQAESLIVTPLDINYSRAEGFIIYTHSAPNAFSEKHLQIARAISQQITITLKNIFSLQDSQESLQESKVLLDASRELFATVELEDVYKTMSQAFITAGADRCTLCIITDFSPTNVPRQSKIVALRCSPTSKHLIDTAAKLGKTYNLSQFPYLSSVFDSRDILAIADTAQDPHLNQPEKEYLTKIGTKSLVIVPLFALSTNQPLGYLFVERFQPYTCASREIALYRTISNQTTMFIENARQIALTRQRARQIQTAAEISRLIGNILNDTELIKSVVEPIKNGFDLYYVGLFMVDPTRQWAILQAGSGKEGAAQLAAEHRLAIVEESMIGWCILNKQARIALDVGKDAVRFKNPFLPLTRSEMALPLVSRNNVIGALTIQSTQQSAFSQDDITSLQIMADQLANAIVNAQLYQTTQQSTYELSTLLEINRDISASMNLDELLNIIVTRASNLVDADQGTIFVVENNLLIPRANMGLYSEQIMNMRIPIGEGISGSAAKTRQTIVKSLVGDEPGVIIPNTPNQPEAIVAIPIQTETTLIGVLLVRKAGITATFSQSEISLLEGIAQQAAIAVENANLLTVTQQAQQETSALYQLSHQLAAAETIPQAATVIVQHMAYGIFDRIFITLKEDAYDPDNTWLKLIAGWDKDNTLPDFTGFRFNLQNQSLAEQMANQPAVIIDDFSNHPLIDAAPHDQAAVLLQFKSVIILPIKQQQKILGWLIGGSTHHPHLFTSTDIAPLAARMQQLSTAIDRIQKTESLTKASAEYQTMVSNIPGAVYRGNYTNKYHFSIISREIEKITGYMPQDFGPNSSISFAQLIVPEDRQHFATLLEHNVSNRKPYQIQFRILHRNGELHYISERGLVVFDDDGRFLYDDGIMIDVTDRVLLEEASQRRSTQLEAITHVAQSASAILEINQLLSETVELINRQFGFYYAAIFLMDSTNEWAELKAGTGEAGKQMLARNHRLKRDASSMVGWATFYAEPHVSFNVATEEHRYKNPLLPFTRSEMALPLITRGKVIGALSVQSVEENAFSQEDIATLQIMANQLANIIENVRLLETTRHNLEQANLLYQTTQHLLSATTEEALFNLFIQDMQQLELDTISINILNPATNLFQVAAIWDKQNVTYFTKGQSFGANSTVMHRLVEEKKSVFIFDTRTDPILTPAEQDLMAKMNVYSMASIPIILTNQCYGVVVISSKTHSYLFAEDKVRFYENIVQQFSITWQSLRLLQSVEHGFRREQLIRQITGKIHAAVGVDQVMQTTVTELTKVFNIEGGAIKLGIAPAAPLSAATLPTGKNGSPQSR